MCFVMNMKTNSHKPQGKSIKQAKSNIKEKKNTLVYHHVQQHANLCEIIVVELFFNKTRVNSTTRIQFIDTHYNTSRNTRIFAQFLKQTLQKHIF